MRMVTGFLEPDSGDVKLGGVSMAEDPVRAKRLLGYLPENAPSYGDMSVEGFLMFCAGVRGLGDRRGAVRRAMATCFLEGVRSQTIETLSKGFRHRVCLAQAILHDPEILVLDEPTDGLDPNQKHEVRTLICRMGESRAIVFSTHILEEVEAVCHRAVIIDRGRIVADGTPAELKARASSAGRVVLRLAAGQDADGVAKFLKNQKVCREAVVDGDRVVCRSNGGVEELARAIRTCASGQGWDFVELKIDEGRLDDVFRSLTTRDTGGQQ
ncbi:MAG: ABC transporter ATP-binding protein [Terrimicrobiaceae bacterium]